MGEKKSDFIDALTACGMGKTAANALFLHFVTNRRPEPGDKADSDRIGQLFDYEFSNYERADSGHYVFLIFFRPGKMRALSNLGRAAGRPFFDAYVRDVRQSGDGQARLAVDKGEADGSLFPTWVEDADRRDARKESLTVHERSAISAMTEHGTQLLKDAAATFNRLLDLIRKDAQRIEDRAKAARALADEFQPDAFVASGKGGRSWHAAGYRR